MITWPPQKSEQFKYVPLDLLKPFEGNEVYQKRPLVHGSLPLKSDHLPVAFNPFVSLSSHYGQAVLESGTYIIDINTPSASLLHPFYDLTIKKNAEVLLVIVFDKLSANTWVNLSLALTLQECSQLTVVSNIDLNDRSPITLFASCVVEQRARLYWNHALVSGFFSHTSINLTLKENSYASLKGCLIAQEGFHSFVPNIKHQEPSSSCSINTRGIAGGDSTLLQHGTIFVPERSCAIEAHYSSDNLLLSKKAKVYARPDLDIHCDDVICSHGVTLGHLDTTQLFYLQSRFIEKEQAKLLLVKAFIFHLLSDFPPVISLPQMMQKFYDRVELRLAQISKSL